MNGDVILHDAWFIEAIKLLLEPIPIAHQFTSRSSGSRVAQLDQHSLQ